MNNRPKGIIFDLDGTLVDTIADISAAMNTSLAEFGVGPSGVEVYRERVGWGLRVLVRKTLAVSGSTVDEDEVVRRFLFHYAAEPYLLSEVYPGVRTALDRLAAAKVPMAVCTNKPHLHAQAVVNAAFPGVPFVMVIGQREGNPRKPDPDSALELAAAMGTPPRETAFVGDSDVDLDTARAAGMLSVLVGWGFRDIDSLISLNPDRLLRTPGDLAEFIDFTVGP